MTISLIWKRCHPFTPQLACIDNLDLSPLRPMITLQRLGAALLIKKTGQAGVVELIFLRMGGCETL